MSERPGPVVIKVEISDGTASLPRLLTSNTTRVIFIESVTLTCTPPPPLPGRSSVVGSGDANIVALNPARVRETAGRSCQGLRGAARQRGRPSCRLYSSRGRPFSERRRPNRRPMPTCPLLSKHSNGWAVGSRGPHDPALPVPLSLSYFIHGMSYPRAADWGSNAPSMCM